MPVGLLILVLFVGVLLILQLVPVPRSPVLKAVSFWSSMVPNEQPHWVALVLLASGGLALAQGEVGSFWGRAVLALAALEVVGCGVLYRRMFPSRAALRDAVGGLGEGTAARLAGRGSRRLATLALPLGLGRTKVERVADVSYGPAGKRNLLDLYLPRRGRPTGPTLIYLHGGGFTSGSKRREGQRALNRLAASGWVCIGANYRMSPDVQYPEYVIDLKKVIAWARSEGGAYGADPSRIFIAGGSAGGHIAACAALTANEPALQPGFEEADTSVSGAIGLYGYYGGLNYGNLRPRGPFPSAPIALIGPDSPPFLVIHGDRDTVVGVGNARKFASALRVAGNDVAFAELPGAQHTFDLWRSIRVENEIDAIEDFAAWATSRGGKAKTRG